MGARGPSDFRSDTVTRPTPEMYAAMATAEVGDDVLGDDPTVHALEGLAADMLGKDAAVFVPSGTMANQIAVRIHTQRDHEILLEARSHVFVWEQGGAAQLSGVQTRALAGERGRIPLETLKAAIRGDDPHQPRTGLLCLENTHNGSGGAVLPLDYVRACAALCREHGIAFHLDGARLANAEAATGIALAIWAAPFDTVSICLSKGLSAPVGSLLVGGRDAIARARRARKLFGGGMRQAGLLAAAGIIALRDMRARLVDDHRRAAMLAEGLKSRAGLDGTTPETNMIYVDRPGRARELQEAWRARGVLAIALDADRVRLVTHKDVDDDDVERAVSTAEDIVRGR